MTELVDRPSGAVPPAAGPSVVVGPSAVAAPANPVAPSPTTLGRTTVGPTTVGPTTVGPTTPVDSRIPAVFPSHPTAGRTTDRPVGPFAPWSPCTPENCLPAPTRGGWFRLARRGLAFACVMAFALAVLPLLPVLAPARRERTIRVVLGSALRAAGVRLQVRGPGSLRPADGAGALVVANHLSWIDVLALGAVTPVTMLAKREVAAWPVIGKLATSVGTVFVDRAELRLLPAVVADTARELRGGALVGAFPEATTWCGTASGDFRRAPFQAAIDAGVPVRPVTVALLTADGRPTTAASFVGEQTLGDSMARVLRMPRLVCTLTVHPLLDPAGTDRRGLARRASDVVRGA